MAVIEQMRLWRKTGHTYQEVVGLLAELGIDTKEGGVWYPATIHRVLTRPVA